MTCAYKRSLRIEITNDQEDDIITVKRNGDIYTKDVIDIVTKIDEILTIKRHFL